MKLISIFRAESREEKDHRENKKYKTQKKNRLVDVEIKTYSCKRTINSS
jgi:hypothetical protein